MSKKHEKGSPIKRLTLILVLILIGFNLGAGQSESVEWQKIVSEGGEFSLTIPAGYVVYNDLNSHRAALVGSGGGASFDARFQSTSMAERLFKSTHNVPAKNGKETRYLIDNALLNVHTHQGEKIFRTAISIATIKGFYTISLSASSAGNAALHSILASIKLNGRQVLNDHKAAPQASRSATVSSLKTSEVVTAALKRKQKEKIEIEEISGLEDREEKEVIYSRRLLVVDRPVAVYNVRAKGGRVRGTVQVRVLFKAMVRSARSQY